MPDALRMAENTRLARRRKRLGRIRTPLGVPLLREGDAVGVIRCSAARQPFTEKQIELVTTFADQAVIAIENARLFEEVQARTRELQESLEYQTATSEVLNVISRSPPTSSRYSIPSWRRRRGYARRFDAIILLREGGSAARRPRTTGAIPLDFETKAITPWTGSPAAPSLERRPVHVHDFASSRDEFPEGHDRHCGMATGHAGVPLLREGEAIGAFMIRRNEVCAVLGQADRLVLQTFADQAVIAIKNVRLFEEVQARTRELQESLEYQTATSDVLGVISRSPSELQPVMDAIVSTAARLCSAEYSFIVMCDEATCRLVAANNVELAHNQFLARNPVAINRDTVAGRTALEQDDHPHPGRPRRPGVQAPGLAGCRKAAHRAWRAPSPRRQASRRDDPGEN